MRAFVAGFAAFASALLVACVQPAANVPSGMAPVAPEKAGVVFGTIGVATGVAFTQQSLLYRAKGASSWGTILFRIHGLADTPLDVSDGRTRASAFVLRLPPGDYEIFDVHFFLNRGTGTTTFTAKRKFSIPFQVQEGRATYLGEFLTHVVSKENFLGFQETGGGYYVVANRLQRDLGILRSKGESIDAARVITAVPNPRSVGTPLFQAAPQR